MKRWTIIHISASYVECLRDGSEYLHHPVDIKQLVAGYDLATDKIELTWEEPQLMSIAGSIRDGLMERGFDVELSGLWEAAYEDDFLS